MVSTLASFIDEGIERMENEVLPVSRWHGINSLPNELLVKIMELYLGTPYELPDTF